jgi:hypothetical protein
MPKIYTHRAHITRLVEFQEIIIFFIHAVLQSKTKFVINLYLFKMFLQNPDLLIISFYFLFYLSWVMLDILMKCNLWDYFTLGMVFLEIQNVQLKYSWSVLLWIILNIHEWHCQTKQANGTIFFIHAVLQSKTKFVINLYLFKMFLQNPDLLIISFYFIFYLSWSS